MKRVLFVMGCTAALASVGPLQATAQTSEEDVIGTWSGTLEAAGLRIVFHIEAGDDGSLSGTMDSPDQGALGLPLSSVEVDGTSVTFGFAAGGATYNGTLSDDGSTISGTWSQGGAALPLSVSKSDEVVAGPNRPQEPSEPYGYDVRDITFANPDAGIDLAGTVTLPTGDAVAGVVLVSGSGPQDRNEALAGHKPFLVLADHLTRQGIAVLRFDDRGVAESGGDFATATSEDFASDAIAAVSQLKEIAGTDLRVGIVGHSEGGLVGPMAANRSDVVDFVVMLAGPGLPGLEILVAQGMLINEVAGAPTELAEFNARIQRGLAEVARTEEDTEVAGEQMRAFIRNAIAELPDQFRPIMEQQMSEQAVDATVAQMNSAWFRYFLFHDPRPDLEALSVPVLSVIGEKDLQVPVGINNPEIEAAFDRGGNGDATVVALPELNHLFQAAGTGSPAEYAQIEETMNPALLELVSDWILERYR